MKKYTTHVILFLIIIASLYFRVHNLQVFPPLDVDEYGIAYEAFSIATIGKDSWGETLPIFFRSFGDYKLPIDIYLSALFFKIFEPSSFWLRFPSVIFSVLYIPTIFILVRKLLKNDLYALLSAILISILPHNFYFSQIISGSISSSYLIFASLTFFVMALKSYNKSKYILISTILLSFSLYAYPLSWIVSPLLIVSYAIVLKATKNLKYFPIFLIFAIFIIPIVLQFFAGGSSVRINNKSAFDINRGLFIEIGELRQTGENDLLAKTFHNKGTTFAYIFLDNYLKHFNLQYLSFNRSDPNIQTPPTSPIFITLVPFYFIGIFLILRKFKKPEYFVIISLLLIAPLPSVITEGAVNAKRYLSSMGIEILLIIYALNYLNFHRKKILSVSLMVIFFIELSLFLKFFFIDHKNESLLKMSVKPRIIQELASKYWPENNLIYTTSQLGEPQIYPLVGAWYSPEKYLKGKIVENRDNWYYIKPFNGLFYTENMEEINTYLLKNSDYSGFAVFNYEELSNLNKNICFKKINSLPSEDFVYTTIKIEPCLQ